MSAFRRSEYTCETARAAATALLDEAPLDVEEAERLDAHLLRCTACRRALAGERRYREAMARLAAATHAPASLRERVVQLLAGDGAAPDAVGSDDRAMAGATPPGSERR